MSINNQLNDDAEERNQAINDQPNHYDKKYANQQSIDGTQHQSIETIANFEISPKKNSFSLTGEINVYIHY